MTGNSLKSVQPTDAFKVPSGEIRQRTQKIQKLLQLQDIGGLFIVQRVDLFYFSGTAQNGYLYIPAEGDPALSIKQYYPRARDESSIDNIIEIASITEIPGIISDTAMSDKGFASYGESRLLGLQPHGSTTVLAQLVRRGIEHRSARIIYPRVNSLARSLPGITRWLIDRFTPEIKA